MNIKMRAKCYHVHFMSAGEWVVAVMLCVA